MKKLLVFLLVMVLAAGGYLVYIRLTKAPVSVPDLNQLVSQQIIAPLNPLSIFAMRQKSYPGSNITIEQTLPDGSNYHQYLTSYQSDGLKIYALLTVPKGTKPTNGWPVIVFNHGYIAPEKYRTFPSSGQYASYYPFFSRAGYIVFKPDYRGNGKSEGQPEGAYYSPAYATDDLNALASIKKYPDANPDKIGMWGHSMGGNITLRSTVVDTTDIKAAVIWGGVVGSYDDLMNNWHRRVPFQPSEREAAQRNATRQTLIDQEGSPSANLSFWSTIDPTYYLKDLSTPYQIQTGGADEEVPPEFSKSLYDKLAAANKTAEFYSYPGDDHNISHHVNLAMQRSLEFFDRYLK